MSEPNGYSAKWHFDDSLRVVESYDSAARLTQTIYDGVSDRVSYTDTNVGIVDPVKNIVPMRASTVYDSSVVFNNLSRPTDSYGPAPVSSFTGAVPTTLGDPTIPHTQTGYDEGIAGLQAAWWDDTPGSGETYTYPNRPAFRGAPKIHDLINGTGSATWNWSSTSPEPSVLPVDNYSGRLTGLVYLATAGDWKFSGQADDSLVVTIDDHRAIDSWGTALAKPSRPPTQCRRAGTRSPWTSARTAEAPACRSGTRRRGAQNSSFRSLR